MSRIDRLKEYSKPLAGPHGAASDKGNLDYWSARATANSKIAPRASDGEMKLPSTKVTTRPTTMRPVVSRKIDAKMAGKDEPDHLDHASSYMRGVRRDA